MVEFTCFIRDVIAKHFYTILASIKFQWILYLSIRELAIHTKTRGNVMINNTLVYDSSGLGLVA